MIVKAPEQKFPTAPEGTWPCVCVDEIDLGKVKSTFGGEERDRNMVRVVWQLEETMDDATAAKYSLKPGSRFIVKQDYTASLDEKAKLRKHLQSWRGRAFTPAELQGFDLENVVGAPALIAIVHAIGKKGGAFANVEAVVKAPKGMDLKPEGYVRIKDRKVEAVLATAQAIKQPPPPPPTVEEQPPEWERYHGHEITDDDVPF